MKRDCFVMLKKIVILMICIAVVAALSACGSNKKDPDKDAGSDLPEGSILLFQNDDGAAKLIEDMKEGRTPSECRVMYDEMGGRPEVVVTDGDTISSLYDSLGNMIIGKETDESITDSYHYITFKLQDGTSVGWRFEGTGILCWGTKNYTVEQDGTLWSAVKSLQDEVMEEETKDDDPADDEPDGGVPTKAEVYTAYVTFMQAWQDDMLEPRITDFLKKASLCDINGDGIEELFLFLPSESADRLPFLNVVTYREGMVMKIEYPFTTESSMTPGWLLSEKSMTKLPMKK